MLKEALGGNCKTTLLVRASPDPARFGETLALLQFASYIRGGQGCDC